MPKSGKNNQLVNVRTGEFIDLGNSTPGEITEALSWVIIKRKELQKMEELAKQYIKGLDLNFEENENGTLETKFGLARIRKGWREGFDSKKFEKKGTKKEKEILEQSETIKKKYTKLTEVLTIS